MTRSWVGVGLAAASIFVALAFVHPPVELAVSPFDHYGIAVRHGDIPYRAFSLEYPPGALPPIVVPALVRGLSYEAAFRAFEALLGAALILCLAYLLRDAALGELVLRIGLVAATPLLLGPVVFFRFDLWPALLIAASLVALDRSRPRLSGALVGAAFAAKLYAGVIIPPLGVAQGVGGCCGRLAPPRC